MFLCFLGLKEKKRILKVYVNKKTPTKVEVKNVGAKGFEPLTPWV